jgi:hypothetical protein
MRTAWLRTLALTSIGLMAGLAACPASLAAEQGAPDAAFASVPAKTWAEQAAAKEIEIIQHECSFIRYRQRTIDSRRDELRDVIETKDGAVARLLMRDNRALTAEEDQAERDRLNGLIEHPAEFQSHASKDAKGKKQATELVRLMPEAMIFTYAADQTPAPGSGTPQVVIDYAPDPKFNPPTTESQALSGLRGRIWIDAKAKTIVRMTGDIFQAVNFGWGILAHVYPGGKLDLEQTDALGDRWNMTNFHEHVTVKALLVKTISVNSEVHSFDFQQVPGAMGYREAIRMLLAERLPR